MIRKQTLLILSLLTLFLGSVFVSCFQSSSAASGNSRSSSEPVVAVIPVYGPIQLSSPELFNSSGIDGIRHQLEEARTRSDVKAVILRVNSPGGSVGSSQELYGTIKRFKERSSKPVVVSIVDSGASGAYWISLAADHIVAQPGALVGSLGVIIQVPDFTQVQERYGIAFKTYKAGKMKDILNPWRPSTVAEEALIETHLKDVHQQFIEVLVAERSLSLSTAVTLADGRIFTGRQAQTLGLVDSLGGLDDALSQAQRLANLTQLPELIFLEEASFKSLFRSFGLSLRPSFESLFMSQQVQFQ